MLQRPNLAWFLFRALTPATLSKLFRRAFLPLLGWLLATFC